MGSRSKSTLRGNVKINKPKNCLSIFHFMVDGNFIEIPKGYSFDGSFWMINERKRMTKQYAIAWMCVGMREMWNLIIYHKLLRRVIWEIWWVVKQSRITRIFHFFGGKAEFIRQLLKQKHKFTILHRRRDPVRLNWTFWEGYSGSCLSLKYLHDHANRTTVKWNNFPRQISWPPLP